MLESSHTHYECQPHVYSISWCTSRIIDQPASPKDNGGHFYIASHGIRIQAAANSLVIWKPQLWHGTTLNYQNPRNTLTTQFSTRGIAFVTSPRLPKAWRLYREKKISLEEAEQMLLEHEPDDESADPDQFQAPLAGQLPLNQSARTDSFGNNIPEAEIRPMSGRAKQKRSTSKHKVQTGAD